ncbi:MAG: amino acid-binding protein [Lachnospiraceae bacterium]|nr:amino acid-binding protein [Lachnospiraceae bacterium]
MIKQISVFLENRSSRLVALTDVLTANGVHIVSVSLSDSTEYALLRMIVSHPDKAAQILKDNGFSVSVNNVLVVGMPKGQGSLNEMMQVISDCDIEYIYTLSAKHENVYMVVKVADVYSAIAMLERANYIVATDEVVFSMN